MTSRIQDLVRRTGFEVRRAAHAAPRRRLQLLATCGVDLVVDVGANTGQYATALRRAGYTGEIRSFEPIDTAFAELSQASDRDPLWTCRPIALGAEPGTLPLHISEATEYSSFKQVERSTLEDDPRSTPARTQLVRVETLDREMAGLGRQLGVKLDVQGFEEEVLAGGAATLRRATFVEVELSLVPVYASSGLWRVVIDSLEDDGFVLAMIENVYNDERTGQLIQFNGMFARRELLRR